MPRVIIGYTEFPRDEIVFPLSSVNESFITENVIEGIYPKQDSLPGYDPGNDPRRLYVRYGPTREIKRLSDQVKLSDMTLTTNVLFRDINSRYDPQFFFDSMLMLYSLLTDGVTDCKVLIQTFLLIESEPRENEFKRHPL